MRTALVLEGGAMRGIYTTGVLDVLLDHHITVDCLIGVSAGALFGINYISEQKGRGLRYNLKYCNYRNYIGMYSLLTTGNIMNRDFCFNKLVYELDKFDFETFKQSPTDFYAVVTNLESGAAEYIPIRDLAADMEFLRASGSMPLVSKNVEIKGQKYLDGGVADSIPLQKALEMGFDRVIVVLTRPLGYWKAPASLLPYRLMYRNYPNFVRTMGNRHLNYNQTLEEIAKQEQTGRIFVLRPSQNPDIQRIEKDPAKIQRVYDLGVSDAEAKLQALKEYLK